MAACNLDEIRRYAILQTSTVAIISLAVIFSSCVDITMAAYASSSCGAQQQNVGVVVVSSITLVPAITVVILSLSCINPNFRHDTGANVVRAPRSAIHASTTVLLLAVLVIILQGLSLVLKALASMSV